jgi:hypothetical protein
MRHETSPKEAALEGRRHLIGSLKLKLAVENFTASFDRLDINPIWTNVLLFVVS